MSLRIRLNLLITTLFLLVLLGGSTFIINNARKSVNEEMQSTAKLTLQLVEVIIATADLTSSIDLQQQLIRQLSELEATRHLQIAVIQQNTAQQQTPPRATLSVIADAPDWFIDLVKPTPMEFRRLMAGPGSPYTSIIIRADPSDEISEVWRETRSLLIFLLLFIISANLLVYFSLGRDLAPIESIMEGLNNIEKGDYRIKLPLFRLPELRRISEKINHMAEVLLRSKEENRYLTQRSMAIQEQERRYLAQELHDELGQSLSAIKAVAISIEQLSGNQNSPIKENARAIATFSDHMYDVAHSMMQRLRPSVLDELGLVRALQNMIDDWNERHADMFCHFFVGPDIPGLNDEININIYRVVQEGLTNVVKHAQASEIHVKLDFDEFSSRLLLSFKDNGIGCDYKHLKKGLGLLGMSERVEAIGGSFVLQTDINEGVEIIIKIPAAKKTGDINE